MTEITQADVDAEVNISVRNATAPLVAKIADLERQLADSESERQEQARLLGMSGSREAKLLAQLAEARELLTQASDMLAMPAPEWEKRRDALLEALAGEEADTALDEIARIGQEGER